MPDAALQVAQIASAIVVVRGHRVLLDEDLARLYGVETKVLNQAVRRNAARFPEDFIFQLSAEEHAGLRSQFVTLDEGRGRDRKFWHGAECATRWALNRVPLLSAISGDERRHSLRFAPAGPAPE